MGRRDPPGFLSPDWKGPSVRRQSSPPSPRTRRPPEYYGTTRPSASENTHNPLATSGEQTQGGYYSAFGSPLQSGPAILNTGAGDLPWTTIPTQEQIDEWRELPDPFFIDEDTIVDDEKYENIWEAEEDRSEEQELSEPGSPRPNPHPPTRIFKTENLLKELQKTSASDSAFILETGRLIDYILHGDIKAGEIAEAWARLMSSEGMVRVRDLADWHDDDFKYAKLEAHRRRLEKRCWNLRRKKRIMMEQRKDQFDELERIKAIHGRELSLKDLELMKDEVKKVWEYHECDRVAAQRKIDDLIANNRGVRVLSAATAEELAELRKELRLAVARRERARDIRRCIIKVVDAKGDIIKSLEDPLRELMAPIEAIDSEHDMIEETLREGIQEEAEQDPSGLGPCRTRIAELRAEYEGRIAAMELYMTSSGKMDNYDEAVAELLTSKIQDFEMNWQHQMSQVQEAHQRAVKKYQQTIAELQLDCGIGSPTTGAPLSDLERNIFLDEVKALRAEIRYLKFGSPQPSVLSCEGSELPSPLVDETARGGSAADDDDPSRRIAESIGKLKMSFPTSESSDDCEKKLREVKIALSAATRAKKALEKENHALQIRLEKLDAVESLWDLTIGNNTNDWLEANLRFPTSGEMWEQQTRLLKAHVLGIQRETETLSATIYSLAEENEILKDLVGQHPSDDIKAAGEKSQRGAEEGNPPLRGSEMDIFGTKERPTDREEDTESDENSQSDPREAKHSDADLDAAMALQEAMVMCLDATQKLLEDAKPASKSDEDDKIDIAHVHAYKTAVERGLESVETMVSTLSETVNTICDNLGDKDYLETAGYRGTDEGTRMHELAMKATAPIFHKIRKEVVGASREITLARATVQDHLKVVDPPQSPWDLVRIVKAKEAEIQRLSDRLAVSEGEDLTHGEPEAVKENIMEDLGTAWDVEYGNLAKMADKILRVQSGVTKQRQEYQAVLQQFVESQKELLHRTQIAEAARVALRKKCWALEKNFADEKALLNRTLYQEKKSALEQAKREREAALRDCEAHKEALATRERDCEQLREELGRMKRKFGVSDSEGLATARDSQNMTYEMLVQTTAMLSADLEKHKAIAEKLRKENAKLEPAAAACHSYKKETFEAVAQLSGLESQISGMRRAVEEAEAELDAAEQRIICLQSEVDTLQTKTSILEVRELELQFELDEVKLATEVAHEKQVSERTDGQAKICSLEFQIKKQSQELSQSTKACQELLEKHEKLTELIVIDNGAIQDADLVLKTTLEEKARVERKLVKAEEKGTSLQADYEHAAQESRQLRQQLTLVRETHETERIGLVNSVTQLQEQREVIAIQERKLREHEEKLKETLEKAKRPQSQHIRVTKDIWTEVEEAATRQQLETHVRQLQEALSNVLTTKGPMHRLSSQIKPRIDNMKSLFQTVRDAYGPEKGMMFDDSREPPLTKADVDNFWVVTAIQQQRLAVLRAIKDCDWENAQTTMSHAMRLIRTARPETFDGELWGSIQVLQGMLALYSTGDTNEAFAAIRRTTWYDSEKWRQNSLYGKMVRLLEEDAKDLLERQTQRREANDQGVKSCECRYRMLPCALHAETRCPCRYHNVLEYCKRHADMLSPLPRLHGRTKKQKLGKFWQLAQARRGGTA